MTTMLTGHFRNALTILFFISLSLNAIQAQVSVTAELDSTYMLIGDRMNIKLRLSFPPSVSSLKVDLANL
ncbi:MAG TPA: hypothetical protein ENJ45_04860, partial [Phaeodactylibacter sp.]|nr:hypothetical protein [Phaeodactylibacter sp.]